MMRFGKSLTSWQGIVDVLLNVFAAVIFLALASAVVLPMFARVNPGRPRAFCQNNLKYIGIALKQYCQDHTDVWPLTLSELYPGYVNDLKVFICGDSEDKVGSPLKIKEWTSYEYNPSDNNRDPATTVVCRERESFHGHNGRNELFADGHVSWRRYEEATP